MDRTVMTAGILPDALTDHANAKLFAQLYRRRFRYAPGLGWHRWDGHRWESDEGGSVLWAAGEMGEALAASDPRGVYRQSDLDKHRDRALSTSGIRSMLAHASSFASMVLAPGALDTDPYALCTPGGIIDLHSGLSDHPDPDRHGHTRSTSIAPAEMPTPLWFRFLADTFGDEASGRAMINFLQKLLGYSITGAVDAKIMVFLYGAGCNGKSVLVDVLMRLLGDYAASGPPGFLMARPATGHPTDFAELRGRRLIVCSELQADDRWDEDRVELLTGCHRIEARRVRQTPFSFSPTHKLWFLGNHRPQLSAGRCSFLDRMRVLPFDQVVSDSRRIDNLAETLVREEGPGILNWLIIGANRYLAGDTDLSGTERVKAATAAYAGTEDHVGRFLGERCMLAKGLRADQRDLYVAYQNWCRFEDIAPISSRLFAARVRCAIDRCSIREATGSSQGKFYVGIGLTSEEWSRRTTIRKGMVQAPTDTIRDCKSAR
ncbi:phage/plasmid primase, P4 family [Streptomyces sp. NPDC006668]|uniref:DNA primase family protein n=1 Tax=Streptomyces sp. NPDC006668 TaxID=3156903 RepID=UPI0033DCE4F7